MPKPPPSTTGARSSNTAWPLACWALSSSSYGGSCPAKPCSPAGLAPSLAAAAFLLAAALTGFQTLNVAVQGWQGTGAWLSAVLVALPLAAVFAVAALHRMRIKPVGS
ncbi:hypothetical protein AB6813_11405 [bacterium RCC_150]